MSGPSTPARSSRTSTPASASSAAYNRESRINALLAFSDDSEDEVAPTSKPVGAANPTLALKGQPSKAAHSRKHRDDTEESESEDDEPVSKPRGRVAARMTGNGLSAAREASTSEEEEDGEDVYEKIRQQLMTRKQKDASAPSKEGNTTDNQKTSKNRASTPAAPSSPFHTESPSQREIASQSRTLPASRNSTPGLFVSPRPPRQAEALANIVDSRSGSDSDLPSDIINNSRVQQLVARRRQERLAREGEEKKRLEARRERAAQAAELFEDDDEVDKLVEKKLTQQARPTRKASKKAIEEMNRETQRMNRNMQLTHQAKVKTRFTTQDFLTRFMRNKPQQPAAALDGGADQTVTNSSSVAPSSDNEVDKDTPPSSPPSVDAPGSTEKPQTHPQNFVGGVFDPGMSDEEPTMEGILSQPKRKIDKGKAPMLPKSAHVPPVEAHPAPVPAHQVRFNPPPKIVHARDDLSDDDLEIVPSRLAIFDKLPVRKSTGSRSSLMFQRLANNGHEKIRSKDGRPSMTPAELEAQLRRQAKLQAQRERDEKIAALKARGIVVMTAEEREKEQMEIENALEKARREADEIRRKEKEENKKNGVREEDLLASDDESGDDYVASEEGEDEGPAELEISGSEDEERDEGDEGDSSGLEVNGLLDNEAGEDAEDEELDEEEQPTESEVGTNSPQRTFSRRASRKKRVIEDDEDEAPSSVAKDDPHPNHSLVNDELAAAFGFGPTGAAPLGMSQMFAGTMEASPTQLDTQGFSQDQDSLDALRHIPSAPLPTFVPNTAEESQDATVQDSQAGAVQTQQPTQAINLDFGSPAMHSPAITRMTQFSPMPDPSQDVGFGMSRSPAGFRAPRSTIDTVILPVPDSPVAQRKGRLIRRAQVAEDPDGEAPASADDPPEMTKSNVFDIMRKAASKPVEIPFDKKKSEAKDMIEEQAEESEDEYAGLGGADDDASGDEADEADKQMIDESEIKVDERELAAYYADKVRAEDEARTSKLYKDLVSGALRRKRMGAFDLDSDEDEQIAERRRMKQREEARKRRLLLEDERIGKLGADQKKEAFLRAIEDRDDDDDDLDFLDGKDADEKAAVPDSQDTSSQQGTQASDTTTQPLAQVSGNALKRKAEDSYDNARKRLPAASRRTHHDAFRKPTSLAEVKESVSFLIDEPNAEEMLIDLSDSEQEDNAPPSLTSIAQERAPFAARRTAAKPEIIDRLILQKTSSATESGNANTSSGTMAFVAPSSKAFSSFKTPSLLRRATTNLSKDSQSMPPPALNRDNSADSGVRRGGSKKSSINYAAREAERRAVLERASERKRRENVERIKGMRKSGGLDMLKGFGSGFE